MNLTQEQIQRAANEGIKLLSREDVLVPSPTAVNGGIQALFLVLNGIANGSLVVTTPAPPKQPRKRSRKVTPAEPGQKE